jgi:hypothetical protein
MAGKTGTATVQGTGGKYTCLILLMVLVAIPSAGAESPAGTMTGLASPQGLQSSYLSCDINRDGIVSSLDALIALQMSTGNYPSDLSADTNGDGKVTSFDAAQILRISIGVLPAPSATQTSAAGIPAIAVYAGAGDMGNTSTGIVVVYQELPVNGPLLLSNVTVAQTLVAVLPTTQLGGSAQTVAVKSGCVAGYSRCDGVCYDLLYDTSNCGSCGHACPSGYTCTGGNCTRQCSTGLTNCNNVCADLLSDTGNCGSCGHACMSGAGCINGQCVAQMVTTQQTRPGGVAIWHL